MEDDQSQPSTSNILEDHDDGSSVRTLTSMDTETRKELFLSSSIKDAFDRISSNKGKEIDISLNNNKIILTQIVLMRKI